MLHQWAGAQYLVSEPRGVVPTCKRLGSNAQWRTTHAVVCAQWARAARLDGRSKWSIYNMLQHAMPLDDHYVRVQAAGESEDEWRRRLGVLAT